jgi:hypothetical protein
MATCFETGETMTAIERRNPENAQLREKINHIQVVSEQLQALVQLVQVQTVAWAREGKVADLPSAELANSLSISFLQQRSALAQIQEGIKGASMRLSIPVAATLISDEELAALMK